MASWTASASASGVRKQGNDAQPVAAKSVYRQEEQANEDEWDNGTAVKPPLGGFTGGQPDKEKKAAKSAEGKAAFRLSIFNRPHIVNAGPRM